MLTSIVLATVLKVVDGDTIKVNVKDCEIKVLCKNIEVRFEGIDAPEIHGKCLKEKDKAIAAKKLVEENYKAGDEVVLISPKRDKYFRLLAVQETISTRLIQQGLAVKYDGKKKVKDWCE